LVVLGLKKDAERAIKRASGVDTVVDKIEELPANQFDDQIRWATYCKIYRDPFLSRSQFIATASVGRGGSSTATMRKSFVFGLTSYSDQKGPSRNWPWNSIRGWPITSVGSVRMLTAIMRSPSIDR